MFPKENLEKNIDPEEHSEKESEEDVYEDQHMRQIELMKEYGDPKGWVDNGYAEAFRHLVEAKEIPPNTITIADVDKEAARIAEEQNSNEAA